MFKVKKKDTRCEIHPVLTIKAPRQSFGVFVVNFEHTLHLALAFMF